jgi:DNA invertase Pin-like site-specific DNA recombinase
LEPIPSTRATRLLPGSFSGCFRPGDTLVVWRLDRLGRSLKHLIETITVLSARGIGFKSITEAIDTTTSGGKLVFQHLRGLSRI